MIPKLLSLGVACAVCLIGCAKPGKLTGEGTLVGVDGSKIAAVTLHGDSCAGDLSHPRGGFEYVDQRGGVKLRGELIGLAKCVSESDWQGQWYAEDCLTCVAYLGYGSYLLYGQYTSTHPAVVGAGYVAACVIDNGEGVKAQSDPLLIVALSGPYSGYQQLGNLKGGAQAHDCK